MTDSLERSNRRISVQNTPVITQKLPLINFLYKKTYSHAAFGVNNCLILVGLNANVL